MTWEVVWMFAHCMPQWEFIIKANKWPMEKWMKLLTFGKDVEIGKQSCKKKLNLNTTKICSLSSKLAIKTPEHMTWYLCVIIVNVEPSYNLF